MSEAKVVYVFTWHTFGVNPCPKCSALNGRQYRGDIYMPVLIDLQFGAVWDLNLGKSLVHPNCDCGLEIKAESVEVDIPELNEFTHEYGKFEGSLDELVRGLP